ncbi:hypothetical protein [Candidatus Ruminimicrobium bovinum]|uniref:hypothetical protein n=1 Tax=Candidatus Ruminimicrobium bovinum TaxID=3242779 RepID=UPI0039B9296E
MTEDRSKSNLNIKKRKSRNKKIKSITSSRRMSNNAKIAGANIIFGLDNGATGTISCIVKYPNNDYDIFFQKTPSYTALDYQQSIQYIARIDWKKLKYWFEDILKQVKDNYYKNYNVEEKDLKPLIVLERPMINADRFKQSKNAARAFEATLIVLEMLNLENNYIIIDSKKWQHYFFGKNTILLDLKKESMKEGIKFLSLFKNKYNDLIEIAKNHGDADSLLISRFALEKLC